MAKRREHKETELELTTLLNVMVVLIAFLLLTAVFTQITIQELKLPAQAGGGAAPLKPPVVVEVIVRKNSLQISNGKSVTETIHNLNSKYDYKKLRRTRPRHRGSPAAAIGLCLAGHWRCAGRAGLDSLDPQSATARGERLRIDRRRRRVDQIHAGARPRLRARRNLF